VPPPEPRHDHIIVIIIIVIIIISFIQGIYPYISATNYVPREYTVAAILLLLFMVLISSVPVLNLLYFYISTFRSMSAVPNMAVFCSFIIIIIIIVVVNSKIFWFHFYDEEKVVHSYWMTLRK